MSPQLNRQFILASRPRGLPNTSEVVYREAPIPAVGDNEVLVRNLCLSLDPAIRGWMSDAPNYIEPIELGTAVRATTIGRVEQSRSADFKKGDLVIYMGGWADYLCVPAAALGKLDPPPGIPLSNFLSVLGATGMTAYFGLLDVGQPKAGETLLVSGAAGAVGSIVGQIGKLKGCRVVGIAGGEAKCRWLKDDCGFDAVIDYKTCGDLQSAIAAACPAGVDIYWDNIGDKMLDAALMNLAQRARIVFCGWISTYNDEQKRPGPYNLWQLLAKSARMEGFVVMNYMDQFPAGIAVMAEWLQAGKLQFREHIVDGLENSLDAFHMLFDGRNDGKLIIHIAD